ncbi:tetratricopeptide repeat protein [Archangium lansingense]|uniref:Tetratricopeptide repeat protein n=1 Tax=Archangium lansingense TaxID=2995310 RepID=A0ABT4AJD8_9BACT|nr:tetratricopeptide repeat protein [Archangium lansinium]MCY1081396.1 tetratricopeptide repeat protein [Archangium lansinium]
MTLSLALTAAALLAAEPTNLPAGHPTLGSESQPPAATSQGLPPGHPTFGSGASGSAAQGPMPEGHPPMTGRVPPTAQELLEQLDGMQGLREREKTFEIASSLGKLYYTNGRAADAIPYFLQAEEKGKATRELFLAQRKKLGKAAVQGPAEANCGFSATTPVEEMAVTAQERAKKGDTAGAAACARAALEPVLEVESMRANAFFLSGDAAAALKTYERVLEVSPTYADALFGRSALLYETKGEDLKALQAAHEGFEAFLAAHPDSPRATLARKLGRMTDEAVKAGGLQKWQASRAEDRNIRASKLNLSPNPMMAQGPMAGGGLRGGGQAGPMAGGGDNTAAPTVSQETMQAMQNVERTPEFEAQLTQTVEQGEELLAKGRYDEALAAYRQVMPLRPDGRVKAGLAWTLVGLGKPTADRVWGVAVSSDPAAVDQLGETLKAKGDANGAKALWTKLAASAPDYAAKASLQAKLSQ